MKRLQDALRFTFTSYAVILIKLNYQLSRQLCNYNGANSSLQIKSAQLGLEPATSRTLGQRVNHYSMQIKLDLVIKNRLFGVTFSVRYFCSRLEMKKTAVGY
jgi:hypothetical protein